MEMIVWSGGDIEPMQKKKIEHCFEEAVKFLPSRAL